MRGTRGIKRRSWLVATFALGALLVAAAPAAASGPKLTVPQADLAAAFHCPIDPTNATSTPIMFVTGTGATGDEGYLIGQSAFEAYGHPVCYVNFPDYTTADIQVSVQYLVYGLRQEYKLAGRKVAAFGISQGGLLPRFALDVLAGPAPQGQRRAGRRWHPARHRPGARLLGEHPVRAGELAAGPPLQSARRDQRSGGRDAGRRLLYDGALAHRRDGPAAGRQASDLVARRGEQPPHPGRLPRPDHEPHRNRGRLGLVCGLRRRDRPFGQGQEGRGQGRAPAVRRLLAPLRGWVGRDADHCLPRSLGQPDLG